jgi:hypothetical protein
MAIVRRLALTFFSLMFLLVASGAAAAPRDKAAQKKIEEAIYTHFLNTDFDAAEGLLLGTVRACEDKCSPAVVAKVWMYVGIIRGSGRNDIPGAQEAFSTALAADPSVALDNEIATDPVKAAFLKVKGGKGAPAQAGAFTCVPSLSEIETRRPVPVSCESDKDVASARLIYKAFGTDWNTLRMEAKEGAFRATIPCGATQNTGKLVYYVQGLDAAGNVVVALGSKEQPAQADVVSETTADPPAFPAEEPPARCGVETITDTPPPPSGGECGAWGAGCGKDDCCEGNLACINGTCGEAECQSDSDCKEEGQECDAGRCKKDAGGPYAKNVVGLHFGADWMPVSSEGACTTDSQSNESFSCVDPTGKPISGADLNPRVTGKIGGGFVLGTMRVMASYERILGPVSAEGRLGFAFRGGKPDFLPVHFEVRLKYWLLGEKAFTKPGFRPWVHLGGGIAQYDATVKPSVFDCSKAVDRTECLNYENVYGPRDERPDGSRVYPADASKQLGLAFVTVGGGVMYAVAKNHGVVLNLNLTIPFVSTGFVLSPSLGYAMGF